MEDRIFIGKEFLKEEKPFYTFEDILEANKDVLLRLKFSDYKDPVWLDRTLSKDTSQYHGSDNETQK